MALFFHENDFHQVVNKRAGRQISYFWTGPKEGRFCYSDCSIPHVPNCLCDEPFREMRRKGSRRPLSWYYHLIEAYQEHVDMCEM